MFETYGVDLKERQEVAHKSGRKEVRDYLAEVIALEFNDPEHNNKKIQDCYDKLAAFYSSDGGGEAWNTMDIDIYYLRS